MIYEIYPPNDDYELWGVEIKPGAMPDTEDISQEILFENIRNQIIEEIRAAKYMIWISVAWFTDPVLYQELLKKKQQGLVIEIALDDCDRPIPFNVSNRSSLSSPAKIPIDLRYWFLPSSNKMSNARLDLPEPLIPVITIN